MSDIASVEWLLLPSVGSYIVFTIDPIGTLASLDDPVVRKATAKMKTQKYVGFVEEALNAHDLDWPFRALRVRMLHRTLPEPSEADGVESGMCCPVLPNTGHPSGREALKPSKNLPWDSCYHHTTSPTAIFRVQTDRGSDSDFTRLGPLKRRKFFDAEYLDQTRQILLRKEYQEKHPNHVSQSATPRHSEPQKSPEPAADANLDSGHDTAAVVSNGRLDGAVREEGHQRDDAGSEILPEDAVDEDFQPEDDTGSNLEELVEMVAMMEQAAKESRPHDTMTLCTVSYDLNALMMFGAPGDFFKEQNYLLQLEKQSKDRAIEKARATDEKAYGSGRTNAHPPKSRIKGVLSKLTRTVTGASRRTRTLLTTAWAVVKSRRPTRKQS